MSKKRILYIEDEKEMIELTRIVLEREGFEMIGVVGGAKGLEAIKREKPNLVLLDLMMPDVDGWEVYRQMKADQELADIPVIIITARTQSIDKVLGLKVARVADYITKPFGPGELIESIKRVLDKTETPPTDC
jgi:two-component system, OmpR family, response regulator VicR